MAKRLRVIRPIRGQADGDCAICCLVMWTGRTYPEVVEAAPTRAYRKGMWVREIVTTARKLGVVLHPKRIYNLETDSGILRLNPRARGKNGHAVVLLRGIVLDPLDGRVWVDVVDFLKAERYETGTLLTED